MEWTLALIKPDAVRSGKAQEIKLLIEQHGFTIYAQQRLQLTRERAEQFYGEEHGSKPFFKDLIDYMTSGPIEALCLCKANAIKAWRELMGPTNHFKARADAPQSMRALYGTDAMQNATHGSDSPVSAAREIVFYFPGLHQEPPQEAVKGVEWTFALIKPDAVRNGKAQEIKQLIQMHGFTIICQEKLQLTRTRAEEFYAEHYGKPFFPKLVEFMTSGPVWALVLCRRNAIKAWRDTMGPTNVFTAREQAPRSLRALYGTDGTQNATHGSDSPLSASREIKFFFPNLVMEPLPGAEGAKAFITAKLQPALAKALTALAREKPSAEKFEAITFLANYMLEHNPNKPRIVTPEEWDPSMEEEDDEADFVHAKLQAAEAKMQQAAEAAAATMAQAEQAKPPRPESGASPVPDAPKPASRQASAVSNGAAAAATAGGGSRPPSSGDAHQAPAAQETSRPASAAGVAPPEAAAERLGSRPPSAAAPGADDTAAAPLEAASAAPGSRPASAARPASATRPDSAARPPSARPAEAEEAPPAPPTPAPADDDEQGLLNASATKVQAAFRGHQARKQMDEKRQQAAGQQPQQLQEQDQEQGEVDAGDAGDIGDGGPPSAEVQQQEEEQQPAHGSRPPSAAGQEAALQSGSRPASAARSSRPPSAAREEAAPEPVPEDAVGEDEGAGQPAAEQAADTTEEAAGEPPAEAEYSGAGGGDDGAPAAAAAEDGGADGAGGAGYGLEGEAEGDAAVDEE